MGRIPSAHGEGPGDESGSGRRRRAAWWLVPVGLAAAGAVTIGLVPALAGQGSPDLPEISAEKLLTKLATSDAQSLKGSVRVSTDLGLPGGLLTGGSDGGSSPFGPGVTLGGDSDGDKGEKSVDPKDRLRELLAGTHRLRVAADGSERQRVTLMERGGAEYSVIHNGDDLWAFDSESDEVLHGKAPQEDGGDRLPGDVPTSPQDAARQFLDAVGDTTSVTVDGTTRVAGQDAYRLTIQPKQSGSTVRAATIAVDADNGAPLAFTLTAEGGGKPVVDIAYTEVSFTKPDAEEFTPPRDAEVTEGGEKSAKPQHHKPGHEGLDILGKGWTAVVETKFSKEASDAAKAFGEEVSGDFGKGTVITTRLINALVTDDGKLYAGAVTKDMLIKAAEK